ncbi:DUF4232 domain-containing protein [Streptomyces kunmingensis]|uniref:DUF4232 domain-containing protein n=1 Tax=Streptomyces kunmingensis TaxID=68225 RepID=A0ABU6CJI5_9ACTN|nr:DUF4232 domain-containing protein [Streptomyces kunmingensis]MEB3964848.1 DUF4232 domain-containing protein [Streptomyces kunmingensis]
MKNLRHRSTLLALAGTALALSLTACQGDTDTKSAPAASSSATGKAADNAADGKHSDTSDASDTTGTADSAHSTASKGSTGSAKKSGSTGTTGEQASAATRLCTARDVTITAATQDGPPYTHLVLTAKNKSGRSCRLAGAPHIQLLESHKQDVPAVAKSKPASPVVLTAGAPAYALVKVSDGGVDEDNEPVSAFSVTLEGDDSTVIAVTAPGKGGIAADPAKALTGYWTPELRNGADDF